MAADHAPHYGNRAARTRLAPHTTARFAVSGNAAAVRSDARERAEKFPKLQLCVLPFLSEDGM